jgi:dTMP kinase
MIEINEILNKFIKKAQLEFSNQPILKGLILVFEGLDGCGKSTQVNLLSAIFKKIGKKVVVSKWNSSEKISDIVKELKNKKDLKPQTWALLEAADLYERIRKDVLPVVSKGGVAIFDRYYYTALVRGVVRGLDYAWIEELYRYVPDPNFIFYCRVNPIISMSRVISRSRSLSMSDLLDIDSALKFYESGQDLSFHQNPIINFYFFQQKMSLLYDKIFKRLEDKVCILDSSKDIFSIYGDILEFLRKNKVLLGFRKYRDIVYYVEFPKGSFRVVDDNKLIMPCDYGFIPNTIGNDFMEVDVLVGTKNSDFVVKFYHFNKKGEFSEIKYALGFADEREALDCYLKIYPNRKIKYEIISFEDFKKEILKFNIDTKNKFIEDFLKTYFIKEM